LHFFAEEERRDTMTKEEAYQLVQEVLDDPTCAQEKRRIYNLLARKALQLLSLLGCADALESSRDRIKAYLEFAYIPGDSILRSMQYIFNAARVGAEDPSEARQHLDRIYTSLFASAGLSKPQIPEMFWDTALGLACRIVDSGIESAIPQLVAIRDAEAQWAALDSQRYGDGEIPW
jgi:hypothetical protein